MNNSRKHTKILKKWIKHTYIYRERNISEAGNPFNLLEWQSFELYMNHRHAFIWLMSSEDRESSSSE